MKSKLAITLLVLLGVCLVISAYTILDKRTNWKKEYLKQIYPLAKSSELTDELYDSLEVLYVNILPRHEIERLKKTSYKANLPGPSCGQLPCMCSEETAPCPDNPDKKFNLPLVKFSSNPVLEKKWPPCNLPGEQGKKCCASESAYKKCMKDGTWNSLDVNWGNGDTWEGNAENETQASPAKGQVFKPALWPEYSLAVSSYDPSDWNARMKTYQKRNYIEGLHSSFSANFDAPGVWFYDAKGSGIFLSLDTAKDPDKNKSMIALNKIHALEMLFREKYPDRDPYDQLAEFILRPNNGDIIMDNKNCAGWLSDGPLNTQTKDLNLTNTGLNKFVQYWLNGQNRRFISDVLNPINKDKLATLLKNVTYTNQQSANRVANTGELDNLIVYLARLQGYTSVQFVSQPNVYTGWTVEVILLGPPLDETKLMYSKLGQFENLITIRNPVNVNETKPCTRSSPLPWRNARCLYCDDLPHIKKICQTDLTPVFKSCANVC